MHDWQEIRQWRIDTRKELLSLRKDIPPDEKKNTQAVIGKLIVDGFPDLSDACIGFYWPFKGEVDLRPLMEGLLKEGADAALPVVVEKDQPLEFRDWTLATRMSRGVWNIPVPAERKIVQPTVLLIPLLGFDRKGFRLGYGGGYYDRTLASYRLKPMTIGVGYEAGRLSSIHPQAHDVPMDAIVTEAGVTRLRGGQPGYTSSPCYLHEFESEPDQD